MNGLEWVIRKRHTLKNAGLLHTVYGLVKIGTNPTLCCFIGPNMDVF